MGYRKMSLNDGCIVYGKPVGYHLIVFFPEDQTIINFCKGNHPETNDLLIYNSETYPSPSFDSFLTWLKDFESESNTYINNGSAFEFLDQEELYAEILK